MTNPISAVLGSREDLAGWLDQQPTRALIQWLNGQVAFYGQQIPALILREEIPRARTATGALQAYKEILMAFEVRKPAAAVDEEEPFTDPAERMSLRSAAR